MKTTLKIPIAAISLFISLGVFNAKAQVDTISFIHERPATQLFLWFGVEAVPNEIFTVDWGDGTVDTWVDSRTEILPYHTYSTCGTYTVTVMGSPTCILSRFGLYENWVGREPYITEIDMSKWNNAYHVYTRGNITSRVNIFNNNSHIVFALNGSIECKYNYLKLTQLDTLRLANNPHNPVAQPQNLKPLIITVGDTVDFSSEATIKSQATIFDVLIKDPMWDSLAPWNFYNNAGAYVLPANVNDYTETNGVIVFHTLGEYKIKMTNPAVWVFSMFSPAEIAEVYQNVLVMHPDSLNGVNIPIIYAQICRGGVYNQNGFNETTEGIFTRAVPDQYGCDSIITLHLSYSADADTTTINAQICEGNTYNLNGFNETQEGVYYQTLPNILGCDSVIELVLSFSDLLTDTLNAVICQGGTYNLNGFNENQAGTYQQITQTAEGCDSLTILNLTLADVLTDTLNVTICQGDTFVYNGQSLSPTEPFSSFNFPFSTADGCDSVVTLNISLHPPISIELLDIKYEYCDEKNGFIEVTTHNAASPVSYLWDTGDPTSRIEHLVGDSIYSLTVTDGNSCRADTSFFLGICRTTLAVTKTDDTCNLATGTITLAVNSQHPATITYDWEGFPDTNSALTGLKSGTYKVTVNDTFCTIEQTVIITGISGPTAEFEATPPMAPFGEEIQFTDKSTQGDGKITHWYWDFDDLQNSSAQNPKHRYQTSGQFIVLLKIEDEHGCTDSVEHAVLVAGELNFPNIFTPVGSNGTPYFFRPLETAGYFEDFQIEVYDRWGVLVWQQHCKGGTCPDYSNDSFWWNGTTKQGKPVSDGVYYWVVSASYSPAAKPLVKNGSVTVVR